MNWNTVINAVLFQLTWFGAVLGGAHGTLWWGAAGITALLIFSARTGSIREDLILAFCLSAFGWMLDSFWIQLGVLDFGTAFAPPWIVTLWFGVSLTINHSLQWFKSRPLIGAVFAGGAAPLCYLGGERLGAVVVPDPFLLGWIVAAWFLVFLIVFMRKDKEVYA